MHYGILKLRSSVASNIMYYHCLVATYVYVFEFIQVMKVVRHLVNIALIKLMKGTVKYLLD